MHPEHLVMNIRTQWPCLVYHEIPRERASSGPGYFAVSARAFGEQLDRLVLSGRRGMSLEAALGGAWPTAVAITFDDGHTTHFSEAFPALRTRGMTATFFVITARIGEPGYLTWSEIREMHRAGMSIQSHSHTHPFLSELCPDDAARDLLESRRLLDEQLGQQTTTLALPGGDFVRRWREADYRTLGFQWIATSRWGPNPPPSPHHAFVRRYTVRRDTAARAFDVLVRADSASLSREGLRLALLHATRSALGASRYARWRRRVLRVIGRA